MTPTPTDWAARRAAAMEDEDDTFCADWRAAYTEAFVAHAVSRGWSRENAETWPDNIVDDAFCEAATHDWCPVKSAEYDVLCCEMECE